MEGELSRTESIALLFIPSASHVPFSIEGLRRAPDCLQDTERLSGILIFGLIGALCIYPHVWLQCPSGAASVVTPSVFCVCERERDGERDITQLMFELQSFDFLQCKCKMNANSLRTVCIHFWLTLDWQFFIWLNKSIIVIFSKSPLDKTQATMLLKQWLNKVWL